MSLPHRHPHKTSAARPVLLLLLAAWLGWTAGARGAAAERPNVVIILCDDMGYADLGCYGATNIATPRLDRLAAEGLRLTSYYVAQAVCSASRAALLTGSLPNRIGILGALGGTALTGIHSNEVTIAELLRGRGYACGIFGKWHLGHRPDFLPLRHGFDEYLGLPYSNDMWPYDYLGQPDGPRAKSYPALHLIDGDTPRPDPVDTLEEQAQLTRQYTARAVSFIERHKDGPFFLYVPHSMPHTPIASAPPHRGRSKGGLYGDVIEEIDASTGEILDALDRTGVATNTLVLFTSDNGPWLRFGNWGGSAVPLREGKGTMFEGGCRVPAIVRWPGRVQAGRTSGAIFASVDILPTLAKIAGATLPAHRLDGVNQLPLLLDAGAPSARETFVYYYGEELQAVRRGRWKYHFPHAVSQMVEGTKVGADGIPAPGRSERFGPALFDLEADVGERHDRLADEPIVARELETIGREHAAQLARERRPCGRVAPATE